MDIQNAPWKLLHEPGRKQPHVSCEADEVNFVLLKRRHDSTIVLLACQAFRRYRQRSQAQLLGGSYAARIRFVRDHDCDACPWNFSSSNIVGDRLKIRAAPRKQDAKVLHEIDRHASEKSLARSATRSLADDRQTPHYSLLDSISPRASALHTTRPLCLKPNHLLVLHITDNSCSAD